HSGKRLGLPERLLAGRKLVEQRAEREEIAAGIAAVALQLLGRHIGCGACRKVLLLGKEIGIAHMMRKAEVEQDRFARWSQDEVFGLEIEMDDLVRVHAVNGVGERSANARDVLRRQRGTRDEPRQRLPL